MDIAGATGVSFLLLTHLSKEAQALGRRIVGASRVVWKLTKPDPEGQPDRRKLAVDKSYIVLPRPLGMTIAEDGCTFDDKPPASPAEGRAETRSRSNARVEEVRQWLEERLADGPVPLRQLIDDARASGYGVSYLYRARDEAGVVERKVDGRKRWCLEDADLPSMESEDAPLFAEF